ncbi:hypothetical protein HID58_043428, partial [Brassica napus]
GHKVLLLKTISSDMKVGSSMAPSTHSNSKAMFRVADPKRGLKKIVFPILSDRFRMHSFTDFETNCDLRGDLHGEFSPDPIKGLRSCSVQLKDWLICMNSRCMSLDQ